VFDPDTGAWAQTMPLAAAHAWHTATLLPNGEVLIVGWTGTLDSAEQFDPNTTTWTTTSSLNTKRAEHTATLLADGSVLIAGGWASGSDAMPVLLDSCELLGPLR
jgi:hypothetical protein